MASDDTPKRLPTKNQRRCVAKIRNNSNGRKGEQCAQPALEGSTCCRHHLKSPGAKAKAAVRAEVMRWGLMEADPDIDPAATLLKLVSQSAARAEHYAVLLGQAYDAAERLREAHETHALVADTDVRESRKPDPDDPDDRGEPGDSPAVQSAKADLDRIFTIGGPAALIGHKYSASNAGSVYAVGEAIRGLVELEAAERTRCADWAAKAVAAGIAERVVRMEERRAEIAERALLATLADMGLDEAQQAVAAGHMARHLVALEAG